jgi:rhodanese-related sulfurtransferase
MSGIFSNFFSSNGVENLDSYTFEEKMKNDENAVLVDTRTPSEFEMSRIPNSELIDFMSPDFKNEIQKLDRSKSYYLYCRSGNRSYHAAKLMLNMGFEKVYNLKPGIIGWHGDVES